MRKLEIQKVESTQALPLYTDYAGQESSAWLCLDTRDGDVYVMELAPHYRNSCSQAEWNGHIRRWQIPNTLTVKGLNQLLEDPEILTDLQSVLDNSEEIYDNARNCYRTVLSEDGTTAAKHLEYTLAYNYERGYDSLNPVSAAHYLDASTYSALMCNGESHEGVAEQIVREALKDGFYLNVVDVEKTLNWMGDHAN